MKKIYLTICLLTIGTVLFAQQKITWGVHAGINISSLTDKESNMKYTTDSKAGFNGGIDVQLPVCSRVTIQPELSFSQLGGKTTDDNTNATAKLTENYLSLPVLVKYKVQNTGLGIYIGPQYSYLLNAQVSEDRVSTSATDAYKHSDFSGIFGAEYYFPCNFGISARYQLGFINIAKGTDEGQTIKNHGFTFTVGYRF